MWWGVAAALLANVLYSTGFVLAMERAGIPPEWIFALDKGELKICLPEPGSSERPAAVSSKEGEKTMLIVLKKSDTK